MSDKKKIKDLRKQCVHLRYIIAQLNDRRKDTICTALISAACAVAGVIIGYLVGRM